MRAHCPTDETSLLLRPAHPGERALDPELVDDVLEAMRQLVRDGMTMVVVTHEMGFGREVGDSMVFMDGGVVVEEGPPAQVLASPREARTKAFLGKVR